jgi:hypothetical protein
MAAKTPDRAWLPLATPKSRIKDLRAKRPIPARSLRMDLKKNRF